MKNFIVIMTIMVVHAASLYDHNLDLIKEEAKNVINATCNKTQMTMVRKASGPGRQTCGKEFFCLAEKSLNSAGIPELIKLKNLIHIYNNNTVSCKLTDDLYTLHKLLHDIVNCTKHFKDENKGYKLTKSPKPKGSHVHM